MKDLINRILKALNIGGRDWAVLLLALLLAFSIWVIHNLSLKYNDYLTVSVAARCSIDGHSALASNTCDVVQGFSDVAFSGHRKFPPCLGGSPVL